MGSSSDALWNPKAFVWYKEKNLLLLPVTLMTSAGIKDNPYLSKSAFQGLVGVSIIPGNIVEKFRITHITIPSTMNDQWKKDCAQYQNQKNSNYGSWIPDYCKSSSTLDMYIASNIWNFSSDFISRVLYVGENLYTIGNSKIQLQNFANPNTPIASKQFKTPDYFGGRVPWNIITQ